MVSEQDSCQTPTQVEGGTIEVRIGTLVETPPVVCALIAEQESAALTANDPSDGQPMPPDTTPSSSSTSPALNAAIITRAATATEATTNAASARPAILVLRNFGHPSLGYTESVRTRSPGIPDSEDDGMGVDENRKGLEDHAQEECFSVAGKSAGDWELVGSIELEGSQMELDAVEFDWPLPGMRGPPQ